MIYRINVNLATLLMIVSVLVAQLTDLRGAISFVLIIRVFYLLIEWGRETDKEKKPTSDGNR